MDEVKKLTAQNVYDYLRRRYGRDEAIDIMDSLEGDPDGYEQLKIMIVKGDLEPKPSEFVEN